METEIYPLNKFRLLSQWSKIFKITDETVIAFAGKIYSNKPLYPDVLIHEKVHLDQQSRYGLENYTKRYLNDKEFRLAMEEEAYKAQLKSIKDKGLQEAVLEDCIIGLTSGLYGIISERKAREMLGIKETKKIDVKKLI